MGLFDNIVKSFNNENIKNGFSQVEKGLDQIAKDVGKEINNSGIKEDLKKLGDDLGAGSPPSKVIPNNYKLFPPFEGIIANVSEKKLNEYNVCEVEYSNVTEENVQAYIAKVEQVGFKKITDTRYDRDNTYIMIEKALPNLHLAFYIKH